MFRPEFPARSSSRSPAPGGNHENHHGPTYNAQTGNITSNSHNPYQSSQPLSTSASSWDRPVAVEVNPSTPTVMDLQRVAAMEKTRQETGKLLSVALQRLRERERPPSVFEAISSFSSNTEASRYGSNLHATVNAVRGAVRIGGNEWQRSQDSRVSDAGTYIDDEDDDEGNTTSGQGTGHAVYSTEQTFKHLTVVRDTLIIQGSTIFSPSPAPALSRQKGSWVERSISPSRNRDGSSAGGDEEESARSRLKSTAPTATVNESHFDDLITILADIVKEDCRYKVTRIRLLCPPNALQGVVLEVASILARLQRNNPGNLTRIGFSMLPAFSTFSPSLHERIMMFFEQLLKGMLANFSRDRLAGFEDFIPGTIKGLDRQNLDGSVPEIQVEWAAEDSQEEPNETPLFQPWVTSKTKSLGVPAWTAPRQPMDSYYPGSLISPLLASIFRIIGIHSHDHATLYRFHETLAAIICLKEDAYADIVDVVAFESSKSRRPAIEVLATFWPRAFGHLILSSPLEIVSYEDSVRRMDYATSHSRLVRYNPVSQPPRPTNPAKGIHEFLIWRFQAATATSGTLRANNRPPNRFSANCAVCTKPIVGMGLFCPCCMLTVHSGACYDHEGGVDRLKYTSRDGQQENVSTIRYSRRQPQRMSEMQSETRKDRHHFEPVHLFSLTLCFLCRKPSWGCYNQGLRCSSCLYFVHSSCIEKATASRDIPGCRSTPFSYKSVTITWDSLRKSWVDFYSALIWKEDELFQKSYDEVSVTYGIFWMELELLQAGTASSSIVVEQSSPRSQPTARPNGQTYDTFELHYFVALYFAQLSGSRLPKSRTSLEYTENCGNVGAEISVIHNLPLLLLAASVIKLPRMSQSGNGDMLQVSPEENLSDELPHPFEIVSLAHIRDALGYEVSLHSDATARFTMSQIHRLGIFMRVDCSLDLFKSSDSSPADIMCTFPSTLAIDASTSVEALFTSIQACLEDLDVSINEFGFLLLVRRCWPSALMTDYALSRLASLVLSWVLTEDDRLLQIVRDFVAVGEPLPGVRTRTQQVTWPPLTVNGETTGGSSGSGAADYTSTRRAIIERYANPWLHHLHDLNRALYAECLYQQCIQLSEASSLSVPGFFSSGKAEEERCRHNVQLADETLKYVVKLCQSGIVWTTFDDLFINWLDTMSRLSQFSTPVIFKNLPRLFSTDDYSANRLSVSDDATNPDISQYMADPWRVIVDAASEDTAGLERCLQWVLVLARSGVEIPNNTLMQLSAFARDFGAPFITHSILAEVLLYSVWVKSFGRSELLGLISSLYARQSAWLKDGMAKKDHYDLIHGFLRHTLAACLLLYGCKRETVRSLRFLDPSQLITLPPRRKSNVPIESSSADPLSIDPDMLDLLSTAAIEGTPETCIIVAKFLGTLVSEETGSLLKAGDVDQFVLLNGHTLCKCAWHFYSQTQIPELNSLRIGFLLRLLIVDTKPLENLLEEILHNGSTWESRFEGITRIFRIILDISTPELEIVGRQWRPDVVFIFVRFFSQSWIDDRAEVRLACEILIGTLLPTHLETMTLCFEEYLTRAIIAERTSLAMFLTLLHPILPSWRLISWKTLVEALGMNDDRSNPEDALAIDQDLEMTTLRATLINLALQLVADGVMADLVSLLQIKLCMVQLLGFQRYQMTSGRGTFRVVFDALGRLSSSPVVQSCFQGLMRALDTSLPCDLPPACMVESNDDTVAQGLLGSVFVDVVIKTINQVDFLQTPYIVARCLLTSLVIILAKHDFTTPLLHEWIQPLFKAVHTVMQLLSQPSLSFDLKQMIFTAAGQAAKQIHIDRKTSTILLSEYVTVTTAVVAEYGASSDHMLAVRGRQFFDEILTEFETQKVYWTLFKYPCSQDFFAVLAQVMRERIKSNSQASFNQQGDSMRDAVVREVLTSTHDRRQPAEVDTPLKNLATYVDVVHHTGYSDSLISYLGFTLTTMAAQITEWKSTAFDPNSLLRVCSLVAQHHKPQSKDLLVQGEKYLRVALARFSVNQETIAQLLQVSTSSHRRLSRVSGGQNMPNYIPLALFETLSGMLRGRIRGQPTTLKYLLDIMCQSMMMKDGVFDTEQVMTVATDGVAYLHDRNQEGPYTDSEFEAIESVAKLMMQAMNLDSRLLATISAQESDASLRMWNFLLLAVLTMDWSECALSLWRMHGRCSQILQRIIVPQQNMLTDSASMELNQALISLRLWLLLIQQICGKSALSTVVGHVADRDQCERVLWNELWPSFERLLLFSISVAGYEEYQTHVALVWQSFADILLFLHHSRSLIPSESSLVMHLVQLRALPINESLSNKISRAIKTLAQPPVEAPITSTLLVLRNDFVAVEKIGWELRRRAEERGRDDRDIRRQFRQPTAGRDDLAPELRVDSDSIFDERYGCFLS